LDLNLKNKLAKCIALHGAGHFEEYIRNTLESFETWCWRRMEKISWTDRVRNEEVLHRVKKDRNILHAIKRRKTSWSGHILRRSCLLNTLLKER
jgi:hypothetical protein